MNVLFRFALSLCLLGGCGSNSDTTVNADGASSAPLQVKVITSPDAAGAVNSTIIHGANDAIVVDAQFTKSGAVTLADAIDALGKRLTHVFITHAHPDHYLGTAVLAQRFPNARFVATPDVAEEMNQTAIDVAKSREALLGPEYPGLPVLPEAYSEPSLSLDGHAIQLLGGLQGDHDAITAVYIPSLGTLLASDIVFADVHAWTATTTNQAREQWVSQLDALSALEGLTRVIPGHQTPESDHQLVHLGATQTYLKAFNKAVVASKDSAALIQAMTAAYPAHKAVLFLELGAAAAFPSSR